MSGVGWPPSTSLSLNSLLTTSLEHGPGLSWCLLLRNGMRQSKQPSCQLSCEPGKLVDHYIDLDDATKADLQLVKTALMEKTGLMEDPLTAGKLFMARCQHTDEKVADFAVSLKKLFKQAYLDEALTSGILLQRFVTGLLPTISQQVLLQGKPKSLDAAVKSAQGVEYALNFETRSTASNTKEINAIGKPHPVEDLSTQLQQTLDQMAKRLGTLETRLQSGDHGGGSRNCSRVPNRRNNNSREGTCQTVIDGAVGSVVIQDTFNATVLS